jgi:uncharacterized protein YchJ
MRKPRDLRCLLEETQQAGRVSPEEIEEIMAAAAAEGKSAAITVIDDPNSPEAGQIREYIQSHYLLPPDYKNVPEEEIREKGQRLVSGEADLREKKATLMLLAHHGSEAALEALLAYRDRPDEELRVWARMAEEECQTFLRQKRFGGLPQGTINLVLTKVGRNEPCPCGSGKKYKRCCGR